MYELIIFLNNVLEFVILGQTILKKCFYIS